MARSATRKRPAAPAADGDVNPKAPCPCGSGRRYKHCHGSGYAAPVPRPFEGLPGEPHWVALRELVPAATAPLRTADGRDVTLASVLPGGARALVRANGEIMLGTQTQGASDDVSRDLGTALAAALEAPAGAPVDPGPVGGAGSAGPRLQELVDLGTPLEVTVHGDFGFWLEGIDAGAAARAGLEQANAAILPTELLPGLGAAYWVRPGAERAHLRWVRPEPEEQLLDALARLRASGEVLLGEGTRYAGAFRAHGLLVPVWDLPADTPAADWVDAATAFQARLEQALDSTDPLTADERRARAGLLSRSITLR
ncbi:MAG: SEC-C domain-containing protein [Actinomycetota bacterium]|nr:SEC-C domain-containing protein [Actinomycetota bacterium]